MKINLFTLQKNTKCSSFFQFETPFSKIIQSLPNIPDYLNVLGFQVKLFPSFFFFINKTYNSLTLRALLKLFQKDLISFGSLKTKNLLSSLQNGKNNINYINKRKKIDLFYQNNEQRSEKNSTFTIPVFGFSHPLFLLQIFQQIQLQQMIFDEHIGHAQHNKETEIKRRSYYYQDIFFSLFENNLTIFSNLTAENMNDYYARPPWYPNRTSIVNVIIANSITGIGKNSFRYYGDESPIQTVQLSNKTEYIGNDAFSGCNHLQSLSIPDSVLRIGEGAFTGCFRIQTITLGNHLLYIESLAFNNCNHALFQTLIIPDSVIFIGDDAFFCCTTLTSIIIGKNVETFGVNAFTSCTSLISVNIPGKIKTIGNNAFNYCGALVTVIFCGTNEPTNSNVFTYCDALEKIIVQDNYVGDTFCGKNVTKGTYYPCFPSLTFTFWSCINPYEKILIVFFVYGIFYLAIF